ncbi:hypothetical protein SBOR_8353 [Sclerotinia borealis F-4128]|uniref:Uncharacterized protein n=1 Tax=Sclerotinia borealis (strain F-4128) TaxID=1432307 RepID=W9C9L9_SCLBF|nr:hypothetical protein SBOR_8353 [Sclerotinia borealis F-4128]
MSNSLPFPPLAFIADPNSQDRLAFDDMNFSSPTSTPIYNGHLIDESQGTPSNMNLNVPSFNPTFFPNGNNNMASFDPTLLLNWNNMPSFNSNIDLQNLPTYPYTFYNEIDNYLMEFELDFQAPSMDTMSLESPTPETCLCDKTTTGKSHIKTTVKLRHQQPPKQTKPHGAGSIDAKQGKCESPLQDVIIPEIQDKWSPEICDLSDLAWDYADFGVESLDMIL